jgi:serine/threonine protein kinase
MPDVQPLRPGDPESVGAYRLTGRLGQGGQGVVYLGEDAGGRRVAVKLLHAHLDDEARRRFVRELAATKRVARFCTAQVLDADLDGDCPFIVSEFVDGASLAETVAAEGVLADGALERLAIGTLTALAAIHQAGIVHRDFKPGNVLMGPDGPRVIDFGIARALDGTAVATQPSAVIGTPAYMAPEQVRGDQVGRPADVWAWAATMVFAATGVPPFGLDNITTVIGRILHADPNLGDMSGPLRDLVNDALAKDPAAAPPTSWSPPWRPATATAPARRPIRTAAPPRRRRPDPGRAGARRPRRPPGCSARTRAPTRWAPTRRPAASASTPWAARSPGRPP